MAHERTNIPPELIAGIASTCELPAPGGTDRLVAVLQERFGAALSAVILYGSCLRAQQLADGVVDLYAVVEDYNTAYNEWALRRLNTWLPPNVFYLEIGGSGNIVRAKYAVVSTYDLRRGCTRWFHPYLWARFAQPSRLVYARDAAIRERIYTDFAGAVIRFLQTTLPALGDAKCDVTAIWENGLGLTYAAELRPERHTRARDITRENLAEFTRLTRLAVPALAEFLHVEAPDHYRAPATLPARQRARRLWRLRRAEGMILSVLRFVKAAYTFRDGVDYAAWKIERHTGVRVEVTPAMRRHPVLFGFRVLWRLIRRDVMH